VPRVHKHDGEDCLSGLTGKECSDRYADFQAAQQVALAHHVVREGRDKGFRKGKDVFSQLVQVILGERETITAGDGEASQAAFTRRIVAMIERYREEHPAEYPTGGLSDAR
jgi:hypothetical protein